MTTTRVKYIDVSGPGSDVPIQQLLDDMASEGFDLVQVVPHIDDKRGNPSVTAGMYLFFRANGMVRAAAA